jgi:hypothetical protein
MKLYTEEQVKDAFIKGFYFDNSPAPYSEEFAIKQTTDSYLREYMNSLTPIELPSDEEIEKEGLLIFESKGYNIYNHYNEVPIWIEGAKWAINHIKQQDVTDDTLSKQQDNENRN